MQRASRQQNENAASAEAHQLRIGIAIEASDYFPGKGLFYSYDTCDSDNLYLEAKCRAYMDAPGATIADCEAAISLKNELKLRNVSIPKDHITKYNLKIDQITT